MGSWTRVWAEGGKTGRDLVMNSLVGHDFILKQLRSLREERDEILLPLNKKIDHSGCFLNNGL